MSDATAGRDPIEVLADSFLARFRRGERPSVEEYAGKYPDLADEIRELLPALVLLEQGKSAAGEATGSVGAAAPNARAAAPRQLGDYLILREVGRGGMGVVYEAVQQSLGRHVALKVLPAAGPAGSALERFRLEARSAARLHHTNIVPVFGVGEDDGVAYYAMQFIRGQGLDVVIDELRRRRERGGPPSADPGGTGAAGDLAEALTRGFTAAPAEPADDGVPAPPVTAGHDDTAPVAPAEPASADEPTHAPSGRAGLASELSAAPTGSHYHRGVALLGLQVSEALAYAHGQGILHRDIKPSNLLLDARGTAWVTDFGLAKAEGSDGPTRTGDVVGTLRYMAPERFDGRSDQRSDVYGLGATLYELLTLRPPFEDADRVRLIERVLRGEPERPRRADPRVPRDLETIVLKALASDPAGRYATAEAMAEDLRRFLADRPILARRATTTERAARWCRRNPALAAASALAFVGLAAAVAILAVSNARIRERGQALRVALGQKEAALEGRTHALAEARHARQQADRHAAHAQDQERLARAQERLARLREYASRINLAGHALADGDVARAATLLDTLRPGAGEPDLRTFEWYHLWSRAYAAFVREMRGASDPVLQLALAPDGRTLAAAQEGGVRLWDLATGSDLGRLPSEDEPTWCWTAGWLPDGRLITTSSQGLVRVWQVPERRVVIQARVGFQIRAVAGSPDGTTIALGCVRQAEGGREAGRLILLDAATLAQVGAADDQEGPLLALGFSPDGAQLATGAGWGKEEGGISLWETRGLRRLWHRENVQAGGVLTFSADGRTLYGPRHWARNTVRPLDAADGHTLADFAGHQSIIEAMAVTPDRRTLVSVGRDRTVRAWATATGEGRVLGSHADQVYCVVAAPDGRTVATGDALGVVRVWDLQATPPPGRADALVHGAGFTADGRDLVAVGDGLARTLDPVTLAPRARLPLTDAFDVSPRGARLARRAPGARQVRIFDRAEGREISTLDCGPGWLRFSPDGRRVAVFHPNETRQVQIWDADSGRLSETPQASDAPGVDSVLDAAFSPDGSALAVASAFRDVAVYRFETRTWRRRDVAGTPLLAVRTVAWSPDGEGLAVGLDSGLVLLLDAGTLAVRARLEGHGAAALGLAFSPDGRTLASSSSDRTIRLWDPETGQERLALPVEEPAGRLAFSPDGRVLINYDTNYGRGTPLLVWRAPHTTLAGAPRPSDGRLEPDSPAELVRLAWGLWHSGRGGEAVAAFRRILDHPDAAAVPAPARVAAQAALALVLDEAGRGDEAAELRSAAIAGAGALTPEARQELASKLVDRAQARWKLRPNEGDAAAGLAVALAGKESVGIRLSLGMAAADAGLWGQAIARLDEAATQLESSSGSPAGEVARARYLATLARLASGDQPGYRDGCSRLLARFGDSTDPEALYWSVWTCAIAPGGTDDPGHLAAAARRLARGRPIGPDALLIAGAALSRAGLPDEAARLLDEAAVTRGVESAARTTPVYGWLFQALALHRLGRPAEARARLDEALAAPDAATGADPGGSTWNRRWTLRLLRGEAESVVARPTGGAAVDPTATAARLSQHQRESLLALANEDAAAGRWAEVAEGLERVVDDSPEAHYEWYRWAIARGAAGDPAAYRRACRRLLDRFGAMGHPVLAERTAKACLILPLDGPELSEAVAVAERAVGNGEGHWVLRFARFARALAAYRSGDHAAALHWADLVLAEQNNHWVPDAATHLVRALALARLGRVAEARDALAAARALDAAARPGPEPGTWHDRVYFDRLRAEAEALLGDAGFPADPFARGL